jgi:NAD(P)-dependent dehydrogenase (short-subunit alcohol dehydrogenase family)
MKRFVWAGSRAVVTGGASGLGRALAEDLVRRGAEVVLLDVDPGHSSVASAIGAGSIACDVSDPSAVRFAATQIGPVDLLINNAGISVSGPFAAVPADRFDQLMAVNFGGVVNACRAFGPKLRPGGHVVNVCSSFAWLGMGGKTAYSASKAAVRAFTEAWRAEVEPLGIGVTLLFPGPLDTGLVRSGWAHDATQRDAEVGFLRRRAISMDHAVQRCLKGVERRRFRVVLSLDYHVVDWAVRLHPGLAAWAVARWSTWAPF